MFSEISFDALKTSWISAGFRSSVDRSYAFKLHLKNGELTTLLTDYHDIFAEQAILSKKFASLNPKLSGPDDLLISKVRDLFKSSSVKHSLSRSDPDSTKELTVSLEMTQGRRTINWRFEGRAICDGGKTLYLHLIKPMMDMLSLASNLHRLEFLKDIPRANGNLKDPFGESCIQQFYEAVVTSPTYEKLQKISFEKSLTSPAEKVKENHNEHDDSLSPTPPPPAKCKVKPYSSGEKGMDPSEDNDSMSPTPPPNKNHNEEVNEISDGSDEDNGAHRTAPSEDNNNTITVHRKKLSARKRGKDLQLASCKKHLEKKMKVTAEENCASSEKSNASEGIDEDDNDDDSLPPTPPPRGTTSSHRKEKAENSEDDEDEMQKPAVNPTPANDPKKAAYPRKAPSRKPKLKF